MTWVMRVAIAEGESVMAPRTTRETMPLKRTPSRGNQSMGIAAEGGKKMVVLIPLGILVIWIILQAWVLPRFGVKT